MSTSLFQSMYGYLFKASNGEGTRGGKVIGHTPSGKPIYESQGHTKSPSGRLPYPGEEAHKLQMTEPQKRKTYMPPDGTTHHYSDSPNLRAYKTLMSQFKKQGVDFMGHISYDPKTDKMLALSPDAPQLIRQVYDSFMADYNAKKQKKPEGK